MLPYDQRSLKASHPRQYQGIVLQGSGLHFDPRASLGSRWSCVMVKKYGGSTLTAALCIPSNTCVWATIGIASAREKMQNVMHASEFTQNVPGLFAKSKLVLIH